MGGEELISIDPLQLQFPFELKKQISCSFQLLNKTDKHVAFKVKTTNPKKYSVRPNNGVVLPRSTFNVIVTMQAQREVPADMECKDRFLVQSVVAPSGATAKDVNPEMFNKELGNHVEECKLRVVYVSPPRPPSPVPEESEDGSSPRASESSNGNSNTREHTDVSRKYTEPQDNSAKARALISKLTEEKNSTVLENNRLRQELEFLRRKGRKSSAGFSVFYVFLVGLIGFLLGYYLRS
ncbi:hypothetical protein LguiA_023946 [Lonicera macranthoides]